MHPPNPDNAQIPALPGWRLHRLEMLNWGTFGGARVHVLEPSGAWSLLVGENGSGKSTAVDAIRTLLVPRHSLRSSFNDAAGGQGKKDRSLPSYIRGQWSASRESEADSTAPKFLRSEDVVSCVLAVFVNQQREAMITLGQMLWVSNGRDDGLYIVASGEKGIAEDLQNLGAGRERNRLLRDRGFAVYETYPPYFRDFGEKMGIPDPSAMELLNQAVGIKEIVSVNDFLRRHLLLAGKTHDLLRNKIIPSFGHLESCWKSIMDDKDQIALLEPIVQEHHKAEEASRRKGLIDQLIARVPAHYGHCHITLLDARISVLDDELLQAKAKQVDIESQQAKQQENRDTVKMSLEADRVTQRIRELETAIKEVSLVISQRRKSLEDCERIASKLDLGVIDGEEGFMRVRAAAIPKRTKLEEGKTTAERDANDAGLEVRELDQKEEATGRALRGLERRRVLIPDDFQNIRDMVCGHTGIESEQLPFAGELVEVMPEHEEWTGVIERLMHNFGVSMLVPERHYQKVVPLINRQRLCDVSGRRGIRFLFQRVPDMPIHEDRTRADGNTVAGRLNYRTEHPVSGWVAGEVRRFFHHVCCRDPQELERQGHGITREGLIRSGTRHVKDDREHVDDRTNYVLGWSPQKKIEALQNAVKEIVLKKASARQRESTARRQAMDNQQYIQLVDGLLGVTSYADIDLGQSTDELQRLQNDKRSLEETPGKRQELQRQLTEIDTILKQLGTNRDAICTAITLKNKEMDLLSAKLVEVQDAQIKMPRFDEDLGSEQWAELAALEEGEVVTLSTIERIERTVENKLKGRASQHQRSINEAREQMGSPMQAFLAKYGDDNKDLQPKADYSGDFVRIHTRLVKEDLPVHEEKFRDFLNDNLTREIGGLDADLRDEIKTHRARLIQVNEALARLDYSNNTFVEIDFRDTRERTLLDFKGQLRDILGTGMNLDENGRLVLFDKIRVLVKRFRDEPEWTKQIADSRNWLDFGIRELLTTDKSEADYFDSSVGKSGGQKAKLAFSILAASLHSQYGLTEDVNQPDTFRLVIIDEVFARTDEPNSRRALKLFESMGFQLILAAPWEAKVKIAESFVGSYHLTLNPANNASTIVRATRELYEATREKALAARRKERATSSEDV